MPLSDKSSEQSWAKRIADQFGGDIPIIPKIAKGTEAVPTSFKLEEDIRNILEYLTWNSKGLGGFSGTCRAAMRIGTLILYHVQVQRGFELDELRSQVEKILESDKLMKIKGNIESFTERAASVHEAFQLGLIKEDEMQCRFNECISLASTRISPEVSAIISRNIEDIKAGKSVSKINSAYSRGWGGDRISQAFKDQKDGDTY